MDLQDKGRFDSRVGQTSLASEERWRKLEPETFAYRFWSYVEKTPLCWLWVGALDAHGYGQLTVHAYPFRAHRLAWLLAHGSIPLRAHILHRCDVRHCVNPNHLFLGDQAANMKDAAEKGRLHVGRPGRRRLSDEAMQDILAAQPERGVCRRLAAQHSVSMSYVSLLRRGLRGWVGEE